MHPSLVWSGGLNSADINRAAVTDRGGAARWADAYFWYLSEGAASVLSVAGIAAADALQMLLSLLLCNSAAFHSLALTLQLTSGRVVRFDASVDVDALAAIIVALERTR